MELLVGVVVHEPVEGRVQVRPHHDTHVQFVRHSVVFVQHYEQGVRYPADGEHDVDHEQSLGQLEAGSSHRSIGVAIHVATLVDLRPDGPDVEEHLEVRGTSDNDGDPHEDDGEHHGVRIRRHAVPDALQALPVERVVPNVPEVEQDEHQSYGVEAGAHDHAVFDGEHGLVVPVVADEEEAVEAHGGDAHEGADARDGAHAAHGAAQAGDAVEEFLAFQFRLKRTKYNEITLVTNYDDYYYY